MVMLGGIIGKIPGCLVQAPEDLATSSLMKWALDLYLAHPIAVPLVGGVLVATVFFLVKRALWSGIGLGWRGVAAAVRGVTWPVRKAYAFAFTRKSTRMPGVVAGGRLPIINEKAWFEPSPDGVKRRVLVVVTGLYAGTYRGVDVTTGRHYMSPPDYVRAA